MKRLELIREEKLFRLIPGRSKSSRLEASGVALANASTALVVFDNLNQIARIDVSLKRSRRNQLQPAPSLGAGFEDVAADGTRGATFGLVESVEDFDGALRGFVAEYDRDGKLKQCARLPVKFDKANKGFEGLAHVRRGKREFLYALREANYKRSGTERGRIDIYVRGTSGKWRASGSIRLPKEARFKDYSALACRHDQLAIVSQESARLWVGELNPRTHRLIENSGTVYRFPSRNYRNVEGIDWLSKDVLIAVSDRAKSGTPARHAKKDQSIHLFRVPR